VIAAAFSRPFWPIFLHVLGAMTLFGAVLTAFLLALAGRRAAGRPAYSRSAFPVLLAAGVPAWVVTVIGAHWIASKEGLDSSNATWLTIGGVILEPGVLILLVTIGVAFWWRRTSKPLAARILLGLSSVYLVLLGVAWLAMSGKWG
jgi:hypothetical protein